MRPVFWTSLAAAALLICGPSLAQAQDQKAQFMACLESGIASLVSERSETFSSPQYLVVCKPSQVIENPPGCRIFEESKTFTYQAPVDFRIGDARFDVVAKTAGASVGTLVSGDSQAPIDLQCRGRACDESQGHKSVAGAIAGDLIYEPTVEDTKEIDGNCLDRMLR